MIRTLFIIHINYYHTLTLESEMFLKVFLAIFVASGSCHACDLEFKDNAASLVEVQQCNAIT